jgi:hypothetical protein
VSNETNPVLSYFNTTPGAAAVPDFGYTDLGLFATLTLSAPAGTAGFLPKALSVRYSTGKPPCTGLLAAFRVEVVPVTGVPYSVTLIARCDYSLVPTCTDLPLSASVVVPVRSITISNPAPGSPTAAFNKLQLCSITYNRCV